MRKHVRVVLVVLAAFALLLTYPAVGGEDLASSAGPGPRSEYRAVGLAACAALAITLSVMGAAYAVGRIGSAAMGAAAEKPELLTRSILFVALAEGLAVLGFAIAMMILQKM